MQKILILSIMSSIFLLTGCETGSLASKIRDSIGGKETKVVCQNEDEVVGGNTLCYKIALDKAEKNDNQEKIVEKSAIIKQDKHKKSKKNSVKKYKNLTEACKANGFKKKN